MYAWGKIARLAEGSTWGACWSDWVCDNDDGDNSEVRNNKFKQATGEIEWSSLVAELMMILFETVKCAEKKNILWGGATASVREKWYKTGVQTYLHSRLIKPRKEPILVFPHSAREKPEACDTRGNARRTETSAAEGLAPTGGRLMDTAILWGCCPPPCAKTSFVTHNGPRRTPWCERRGGTVYNAVQRCFQVTGCAVGKGVWCSLGG